MLSASVASRVGTVVVGPSTQDSRRSFLCPRGSNTTSCPYLLGREYLSPLTRRAAPGAREPPLLNTALIAFIGSRHQRDGKNLQPTVNEIYDRPCSLCDDEPRPKTGEFRSYIEERTAQGETLRDEKRHSEGPLARERHSLQLCLGVESSGPVDGVLAWSWYSVRHLMGEALTRLAPRDRFNRAGVFGTLSLCGPS
jgi:hypothetical protein